MSDATVALKRLILGPLWFLFMLVLIPLAALVGLIYYVLYTVYLFTVARGDIQQRPPDVILNFDRWFRRLTSWGWDNAGWVVSGSAESRGFQWLP